MESEFWDAADAFEGQSACEAPSETIVSIPERTRGAAKPPTVLRESSQQSSEEDEPTPVPALRGQKVQVEGARLAQRVHAVPDIQAVQDVHAVHDIEAAQDVQAAQDIKALQNVQALQDVQAVRDVQAAQDIEAVPAADSDSEDSDEEVPLKANMARIYKSSTGARQCLADVKLEPLEEKVAPIPRTRGDVLPKEGKRRSHEQRRRSHERKRRSHERKRRSHEQQRRSHEQQRRSLESSNAHEQSDDEGGAANTQLQALLEDVRVQLGAHTAELEQLRAAQEAFDRITQSGEFTTKEVQQLEANLRRQHAKAQPNLAQVQQQLEAAQQSWLLKRQLIWEAAERSLLSASTAEEWLAQHEAIADEIDALMQSLQ